MRKITSLLMLFCMCVGMAWGQILTTSPTAGKSYTLKCKATDHVGFIGDNGTIVHGRSAAPTSFVFEAAEGVENGFYIKSEVSGLYLYAEGDANSNVVLSSENKTTWVVNAPAHSAGYVSLAAHGKTDLYLNNNGGTNSLKLNSHPGGPDSGRACSLWQLRTPSINVGAGKYYRIINKANANKTITDQESNVLTTKDKVVNDYQQIWYVQGDNYQGYTLKSIFSNRYFNYVDEIYKHWGTAENAVKFYIGKAEAATNETPDYFYFTYNTSAVPETEAYAHYSHGNIVRWRWADKSGENYTTVNGSLWQFEEVDASDVNTILDGQYSALTNSIKGEITKANETLTAAGFSFSPFTLTTGNTTCPAEYNALSGGSDGGGVAALLDDDDNTFMHTDYSSRYFEPHYIQVDLGEVKEFTKQYITFSYRARHNNQGNNPETMIIKGSVDGTTYEDITTLTNLPDGLIEYESNLIGNGKAYRYFRFVVTATTNNDSRNGYVFFSLSKFRLNLVDVNDTYVGKANVLLKLKNALVEQPAERPAEWCPLAAKNLYNELQELNYGATIREYPFTLTTDVNNPVCYQILSGRANQNNGTPYYFTLKPNDGGKVKLETNTQNNVYAYWFFMEDPATGKLMIVPFMEENKPLGYVTVTGGNSKLTNVHSTAGFAGYYYEVIEYAGVNGFPYAFKPYKATTNVSNHGGVSNFMGFHDGAADAGTAVKFEAKESPSLLYRQLSAAIASANDGCPRGDGIGHQMNRYTVESVNAYKAKVAEAEALYGKVAETTDDEITAQKNTLANLYYDVLEINLPQDGKFYRIRCTDGNRRLLSSEANKNAEGQAVDMRLTLANTVTDESIYCYSGNHLISYTKGLTINDRRFNEVGGNSTVTFSKASEKVLGTYNIKVGNNHIYGAGDKLDSGSGTPDTRAGYRWWVEEVTELPVTITAAQYATFYAPCNVTLPEEGLTAYYVSNTNSTHASLEEVGNVIPANTGVLLFAEVTEPTTYMLTIGGDASEVNTLLEGTVAKSYVAKDAYVLGLLDSEVGFYTATKNQQGNTSWLNNGFKAYLPKTGVAATLRFNFGGTTAIESVLNNGVDANAPIYDLSGRRVMNAVKGGIYIQNGKKFIVK